MRRVILMAAVIATTAGCIPRPSERLDARSKTAHYNTIAVIAGGSRREHVVMTQRARERIRKAQIVNVVNVKGKWDTEIDAAKGLCTQGQVPALDGFVIVQGDNLALWDCGSMKVSWEADGAYEGVDYMTRKLVEFLQADMKRDG